MSGQLTDISPYFPHIVHVNRPCTYAAACNNYVGNIVLCEPRTETFHQESEIITDALHEYNLSQTIYDAKV